MKRSILLASLVLTACATTLPVPGALPPLSRSLPLHKVWTYADAVESERVRARQPLAASDCCVYWVDGAGYITAFDAARGRTLWRVDTAGRASSGVGVGPDVLYVGTRDGDVLALNPVDGAQRWRTRVPSEVIAAPTGAKDVVVAHTVDGKVVALSASDGHVLWTYEGKVPLLSLRGVSSPVIENDQVLVGLASGQLIALKLWDGTENWQVELAAARGRSELERMVDADVTPRVRNGVVFASAYHGRIAAIDIRSGRTVWTRDLSSSIGLALDNDNVYVTDNDGVIWAMAQGTGTVLWKQDELSGRGVAAPAAVGGQIVVGDRGGYLNWLQGETGQFTHRLFVEAAPVDHGAVVHREVLYTATRGGVIDAFELRNVAPGQP